MKRFNLLVLALVALLLAGCTATGNVVKDADTATDATLKSLQIMTHSAEDVDVPAENEVSLYITNGGFSPAVVEAKLGQTIVVTSYYVNGIHFSIADLGVEETLNEADTFRFVADQKGEFPYICMDCSPMLKGLLVVN
ncbi:MAG: cupredoxin domain-containing protein [Nanoarchaeota archaeon]|nr:cupredoxin domain-containing protein [Nanoarchaeota archaeon]